MILLFLTWCIRL